MPVKVAKRGTLFRVVEVKDGKVSLMESGKPRDGGGHKTIQKAFAQAAAINKGKEKKDGSEHKKRFEKGKKGVNPFAKLTQK